MNKRIVCMAMPLLALLMSSVYSQSLSTSSAIGPNAVWDPPPGVEGQLYSDCAGLWGDPELVSCVSSIMHKNAASPQAIEFAKHLGGKGFLTSFRKTGRVDIGIVYYFVRGNEPGGVVFLNGDTPIVDVESPCCPAAQFLDDLCNCPEGVDQARGGWHPSLHAAGRLPDGGQRFVIRYEGKGSHAGDVETWIYDAYDFSAKGKFIIARFLFERTASKASAASSRNPKSQPTPKRSRGTLSERLVSSRADLITAAKEYKASLEKLLPFEEDECKRAAEEVEVRKQLVTERVANESDLQESESRLAAAEARLAGTRKQLREADAMIAEASRQSSLTKTSPNSARRSVKQSKPRKPAQKLPPR